MSKIDSFTFDKFLAAHNPFEGESELFDLSDVTFVSAAGMIHLAVACHALFRVGRKPKIKIDAESVRGYLSRSGFFSALEGVATIDPPLTPSLELAYSYHQGGNPFLIEVTRLENGQSLPDLLDRIILVLRKKLKYRKREAFDVAIAISELGQNTFDHNANTYGFLAMQGYGAGSKRFLEVAVADFGNGVRTTLERNPRHRNIRSDIEAISLAIQPGVSEHEDRTRGTGLHHLLEITYQHGGSVQIRSGRGKAYFRMDRRKAYSLTVPLLPGVQVALSLPTKRKGS